MYVLNEIYNCLGTKSRNEKILIANKKLNETPGLQQTALVSSVYRIAKMV